MEIIYLIVITAQRPEFGEDVDWVYWFHARATPEKKEWLADVARKAYKKVHPDRKIKEVQVFPCE